MTSVVKNATAWSDDYRNLPIGVFDSGICGLTVQEAILSLDVFHNDNCFAPPSPVKPHRKISSLDAAECDRFSGAMTQVWFGVPQFLLHSVFFVRSERSVNRRARFADSS